MIMRLHCNRRDQSRLYTTTINVMKMKTITKPARKEAHRGMTTGDVLFFRKPKNPI